MVLEAVTIGAAIVRGVLNWGAASRARREARRLARDATARGEEEVRRYNMELKQLLGQQRTQIAAQNVDVAYGDADRIRRETVAFGLEDVETIRLNAAREARGYKSAGNEQSRALKTQAIFDVAGGALDAWSMYNRAKGVGGVTASGKSLAMTAKLNAPTSLNLRTPFNATVGRAPAMRAPAALPSPRGLSR